MISACSHLAGHALILLDVKVMRANQPPQDILMGTGVTGCDSVWWGDCEFLSHAMRYGGWEPQLVPYFLERGDLSIILPPFLITSPLSLFGMFQNVGPFLKVEVKI